MNNNLLLPLMLKQPFHHHKFTKQPFHFFDAHIGSYTQLLNGSSNYYVTPSDLNVQPTTQIHVAQSQTNEISHDYHAKNGLPDEVVGDFSDNEDEILAVNDDNNINDNNDNDIQFLFQPATTKNVYRPYPNCVDIGDNQVIDNPNYRHFLDLPQQSKSQDGELYRHHHILKSMTSKTMSPQEESYNIHVKDLQALQLFIPGTIVRIQTIPALDKSSQPIPNKVIFHQLFWSFKAWIDAFVFCKPMVQINGTWLYGRYKGILLIVVAQDHLSLSRARQQMIDTFFAKLENPRHTTTWQESIKSTYRQPDSGWTTDNSSHVFCIRHIGQNYKKQFKSEDERKSLLQKDNPYGIAWLDQIPREQRTLAWNDGKQWGHMTTNLVESLNLMLKKMRNFSITALVKITYKKLSKYFVDRGTQGDAMIACRQVYTLIAAKFIIEEETKSNTHFRDIEWENSLRLDQRTCNCEKLQKLHIPYAHFIITCKHINIDYLQYVHSVYTLDYVSSVCKVPLAYMCHHDY
ncbi:hypothetical protein HKD37_07G019962 [Glycine soja]